MDKIPAQLYNLGVLETFDDILSLAAVVFFAIAGLYFLVSVSNRHHEARMRAMEERYYRYYDNADDDATGEDDGKTYYEE
jgi:hypothetical protein